MASVAVAAVAVAAARVLHKLRCRQESLPFTAQFIIAFVCFSRLILTSSLEIICIFAFIMNTVFSVG